MDSSQMDKMINSKDQLQSSDRFATTKETFKNRSNSLDQIQAKQLRNTGQFGDKEERLLTYIEVPNNQPHNDEDNNSESMSSSILSSEKQYDEKDVFDDFDAGDMNFNEEVDKEVMVAQGDDRNSKIKSQLRMTGMRLPGIIMCRSLPAKMRIHLKKGVTEMSMFTCFMFDLALFLIFSVNIMYHDDDIFAMTELSLLGSCFLFGFLFEIVGRKKIFTMRLLVTSVASAFVPFIMKIPVWIIQQIPAQTFAFVMCSVSLTVPVIPDFVKYRRRGVAYGYMGLILAISMFVIMTIDESGVIKKQDQQWMFVGTSAFGIVTGLSLCWFLKDRQDFNIEFKFSFFINRIKKVWKSTLRNLKRDKTALNICISMFIVNNVIFTIFFVNKFDNHAPKNLVSVLTVVLGFLLVPSIFFIGIRCDNNSPWTTLIGLYFFLIFSLLKFALKGEGFFLEIVRSMGFSGTVIAVFNIYLVNLVILSKSVSRECRGLMFGICCGVGAFGAFVGLTLGQIIHDHVSPETLFLLEIMLAFSYITLYFALGGKKQFVDRWRNEKYMHSGIVALRSTTIITPQQVNERSNSVNDDDNDNPNN